MEKPNPGTPEAIEMGCTCDPKENEGGRGKHGNWLIVNPKCPVHDMEWMIARAMQKPQRGRKRA